MPDTLESLAIAVDRLNRTIDRLDRTLALADPLFAALDSILPRLEQAASTVEDLRRFLAKLPGAERLGRITGVHFDEPEPDPKAKRR